jgi:hypothetical protein
MMMSPNVAIIITIRTSPAMMDIRLHRVVTNRRIAPPSPRHTTTITHGTAHGPKRTHGPCAVKTAH